MKHFDHSGTSLRCAMLVLATALLGACSGVGIVASSDPMVKLNEAEELFRRQDRPLAAERLILEAMEIYRLQGNARGLGNANREYADLLRSTAVAGKWQKHYQDHGFLDRSVNYENRFEKSTEYYEKALAYYTEAEKKVRPSEQWDDLTNLYFNMAWTASQLGHTSRSCAYYDQSLSAYEQNMARHPGVKPYAGSGAFADMIRTSKKRLGCPSSL